MIIYKENLETSVFLENILTINVDKVIENDENGKENVKYVLVACGHDISKGISLYENKDIHKVLTVHGKIIQAYAENKKIFSI